jgi:hypothetical protein
MPRGRGAPSEDGDLTAEAIFRAAIPMRRSAGRIPNALGPLLRRVRRPGQGPGIDGKTSAAARRAGAGECPTATGRGGDMISAMKPEAA